MKYELPAGITVVLGAIAGVVVGVVGSGIVHIEPEWKTWVEAGIVALGVWGVSPIVGPQFRNLLHLTGAASFAISAALGTVVVALAQVHMSADLHGVLAGIVALAAYLGFAPDTSVPPVVARR